MDGSDFLFIQRNDPSLIPQWEVEFGTDVGPLSPARAVPKPATWVMILPAILRPSLRQRRVVS